MSGTRLLATFAFAQFVQHTQLVHTSNRAKAFDLFNPKRRPTCGCNINCASESTNALLDTF